MMEASMLKGPTPMKEQSLGVAIVASHLDSKTGLTEQLRKMGYTVITLKLYYSERKRFPDKAKRAPEHYL